MAAQPFEGVRVLDLSSVWAAPYAVQLLAGNGADVIKVEHVTRPDFRLFGPFADDEPGERYWERSGTFNFLHRNKLGVTLNLREEVGIDLFKDLVRISDVVVENYTPRVMQQFGLDYAALREIRPDLIMLSFTGYGHTGPWSQYSAVGDAMEATCGFCEVTGYTDGPPMKAGYAYVDLIACWYCALALATALEQRSRTGQGQWLDVSMYECGVSFLGDALLEYQATGIQQQRTGNDHPWAAPHGCFPCLGHDQWVAISVSDDDQWLSLCTAMQRSDLAEDTRYADGLVRWRNRAELRKVMQEWTKEREARSVMEALQAAGVPASRVFNNRDLLTHPHLAQRGYYQQVQHLEHTGLGRRLYPRPPFLFRDREPNPSTPPPGIGEHNSEILGDLLGFGPGSIQTLYRSGVAGNAPVGVGSPFETVPLQALLESRQIECIDADYEEKLKEVHSGVRENSADQRKASLHLAEIGKATTE